MSRHLPVKDDSTESTDATLPPPRVSSGHSINAPTGRWQNRKDIHWYAREVQTDEGEKERQRKAEIKRQKELEENALSIALGYGPTLKEDGEEGTGANSIKVEKTEKEKELDLLEAEEKKRKKECVRRSFFPSCSQARALITLMIPLTTG